MVVYIQGFGEFEIDLSDVSVDAILAELESQGIYLPKQDWELEEAEEGYILMY